MFSGFDTPKRIAYLKQFVTSGRGTPEELARAARELEAYQRYGAEGVKPSQQDLFEQVSCPVAVLPFTAEGVSLADTPSQGGDVSDRTQNIKIWPIVGLAAINAEHGGAWRAWALAHSLDREGSGRVLAAELVSWLTDLGVGSKSRRRWIHDALIIGLFQESGDYYYLTGLARAALMFGCKQIGAPAVVSAETLVRQGWRALVWGAYIATLHGRPVSQETKHKITGVDPRTQRNYQAAIPGDVRRNYAETNTPGDHVTGVGEGIRSGVFVGNNGKLVYRLPDIRLVSSDVARLTSKGRSRKAQKIINLSYSEVREKGKVFRLFHDTAKGVKATLRQIVRADLLPWDTPGEVYELSRAGRSVNLWLPVAVGGITP